MGRPGGWGGESCETKTGGEGGPCETKIGWEGGEVLVRQRPGRMVRQRPCEGGG